MAMADPTEPSVAISDASDGPGAPHAAPGDDALREIPSVATIIAAARRNGSLFTEEALTRVARREIDAVRGLVLAGHHLRREEIEARVVSAILDLEEPRLRPVLNATGVVIHTNLGRAPVSADTADAMRAAAANAVALEIEPESNERGGRMREISALMHSLTGAEATLVVNNCASAVLLTLAAVAAGKGVVVSRGEAVEIGGGFRVPDVLRQSGARLIEVGTTNRTYVRDYANATDEETAAFLKVHPSNFRTHGFVHAATTAELVTLARERGLIVLEDLGSGALLDTTRFGLAPEPTLSDAISAGAALVMASGDKLLGGPQAGIIAGSNHWVERVAQHPLARAVRADKTALAGIATTLRHYARGEAESQIPIWRMIGASETSIQLRAGSIAQALTVSGIHATTEPVDSTVGGGSLPGETLSSWAIVIQPNPSEGVEALARQLRLGDPRIFGRIEHDKVLLDLRTVLPDDDSELTGAVKQAVTS
ncbi:MAG: L-seryl-tRNA(Sec) selenium transferase [Thermomicrobiales bacterium]